jgi:hypothetical protein
MERHSERASSFSADGLLVSESRRSYSSLKVIVFGSLIFLGTSRTRKALIILPHIFVNCLTGAVILKYGFFNWVRRATITVE